MTMTTEQLLGRMTEGRTWPDTAAPRWNSYQVTTRLPPEYAAHGAARALWQAQNAVTARHSGATEYRGRTAILTNTEVAAALRGLDGAPLHMGRLMLLEDETEVGPLMVSALEVGLAIAQRYSWKSPHAGFVRAIMALAIAEVMQAGQIVGLYSDRRRAREVRIAHSNWLRTWAKRYEQHLFPTVASWPVIFMSHLSRRL